MPYSGDLNPVAPVPFGSGERLFDGVESFGFEPAAAEKVDRQRAGLDARSDGRLAASVRPPGAFHAPSR